MYRWAYKKFEDLQLMELYAIGHLRQEVFVVEQDCPYIDFDFKDPECGHLMGWDAEDNLIAYSRLVPVGVSYPAEIAIGRVITSSKVRGQGIGIELMQRSIQIAMENMGKKDIRISAQDYLLKFYASFGFEDTGKKYLEDGIPHTEMLLKVI